LDRAVEGFVDTELAFDGARKVGGDEEGAGEGGDGEAFGAAGGREGLEGWQEGRAFSFEDP
jgi:hypothetical protein